MEKVLGLDLGSKRIGVALASGAVATPYEVVERGQHVKRIRELLEETGATSVVVGLPYSLDGSIGPAARAIAEEVETLRVDLGVPIETYDERFTTVTAHQVLLDQNRKMKADARRRVVDKVAAAVMLQSWLDSRRHDSS